MRVSIGRDSGSGMGGNRPAAGQPVGQVGVGQFHHRFQRVQSSSAEARRCVARTKPPISRSFSCVPRWVARNSRRRRRASGEGCSGSRHRGCHIAARFIHVSARGYRDPGPAFRAPDHAARHRPAARGAAASAPPAGSGCSTCCSTCRNPTSTGAARPRLADARAGQVATLAVEVVRHEPPANRRQPWRVVVTDGTGFAELVFFKFGRAERMQPGRAAAGLRQAGELQRPADDAASGPRRAGGPAGADAGDRAGLAADRRAVAAPGGGGDAPGAGAAARVAGMARSRAAAARRLAGLRRGAARGAGAGWGRAGWAAAGAAGL